MRAVPGECATVASDPFPMPDASPPSDVAGALARLSGALAEDALFVVGSAAHDRDALEGVLTARGRLHRRRAGSAPPADDDAFDAWLVDMARAMAPIAPPVWMPMMEVVREKVTLEMGARGLRSLFSSKPSDKDVARVKRYGSLAVRMLRAVLAADGPIDAEERTTVGAVIAALGLPESDASALSRRSRPRARDVRHLRRDRPHHRARHRARRVARGSLRRPRPARGASDPGRRAEARHPRRRGRGVAPRGPGARRRAEPQRRARGVDGVRFLLSDRCPGLGVQLGALVGSLMLPRRFRDEALASVGQDSRSRSRSRHASSRPRARRGARRRLGRGARSRTRRSRGGRSSRRDGSASRPTWARTTRGPARSSTDG